MVDPSVVSRLRAKTPTTACFVRFPDAGLVESLGLLGWHAVVIDAEHGAIDREACEHMVRGAEVSGTGALVRVAAIEAELIQSCLDAGCVGVHVPGVRSAADARRAVAATRYAPRGTRGLAASRSAHYGLRSSMAAYVKTASADPLVVLHIETIGAVDEIDEIVRVPGVDVVFLGVTDLSAELGVPGCVDHPDVLAAVRRVRSSALAAGIVVGAMAHSGDAAMHLLADGTGYITTTVESILAAGTFAVRPRVEEPA